LDDTPGLTYPAIIKSVGEAPKQFGNVFNPATLPPATEDFDLFDDMGFNPEDAEDLTEVTDTGEEEESDDVATGGEDEEEDEFGGEFSDNEGFEDEGKGHDDY